MSKFRGLMTPLKDIPLNVAVEIIDFSVFYKPEVYFKDACPNGVGTAPVFGIITNLGKLGKLCTPQFRVWCGDTKFKSTYLYSSKYDEAMWTGNALDENLVAIKVLTGAKGREITEAWAQVQLMNRVMPIFGGYIGFDPEIFVVRGGGEVMPAWEFLPDKGQGTPFHRSGKSAMREHLDWSGVKRKLRTGTAYWDGFQAEMSVNAGPCVSYVVDNVRMGLVTILEEARKVDPTARLSLNNSPQIPLELLEESSDLHVGLGCKPSLNAYNAPGEVVENPRALPFRFAGGHVHLGRPEYRSVAPQVVKAIDAIMGVASVGMFSALDKPVRRRFYGRAGEYRLPAHGLEYRVLSNAWLAHPACMMVVSDMTRDAAAVGFEDSLGTWLTKYSEDRVRDIINNCDVSAARKYVRENELIFRRLAAKRYGLGLGRDKWLLQAIHEGFDSLVDFNTIEDNWLLTKPTDVEMVAADRYNAPPGSCWLSHCETVGRNFGKLCTALDEREALVAAEPAPAAKVATA